jgi:DNA-binding FrmR family transcriptional regulator
MTDKILHRLRIAKGHLEKVIAMREGGSYCIDVMLQLQAVEKALKNAGDLILENHLKTCVASSIKKGKTNEVISEVMKVMQKSG